MEALGAELRMVPSEGGNVTPALFERFKERIAVLAREPDTFWTVARTEGIGQPPPYRRARAVGVARADARRGGAHGVEGIGTVSARTGRGKNRRHRRRRR
jgi:hypothetical protein